MKLSLKVGSKANTSAVSAIVALLLAIPVLILTGCTEQKTKNTDSENMTSMSSVKTFHDDLESQKAQLRSVGYNLEIGLTQRHELNHLNVTELSESDSVTQDNAKKTQVLKSYSRFLNDSLDKYQDKWVYFAENPTRVFSKKSQAAIKASDAQAQSLMDKMN